MNTDYKNWIFAGWYDSASLENALTESEANDARAKLDALNASTDSTPTPEGISGTTPENTTSAQTGDSNLMWLYVALILLVCTGGAVVVYKKKNFTR